MSDNSKQIRVPVKDNDTVSGLVDFIMIFLSNLPSDTERQIAISKIRTLLDDFDSLLQLDDEVAAALRNLDLDDDNDDNETTTK